MDSKFKVLVVDDEPMNIMIMEEILEDIFDYETAASGFECLEKAGPYQPNIILLDINMPKMDGYEACRRLKSDAKTQNIPIIFVSALGLLEEKMAGYEAGGDDYLVKPFEEKELIAKINLTCKQAEQAKEIVKEVTEVREVAMTAMTNAADLGQILHFLEQLKSVKTYQTLAEQTVDLLQSQNLSSCIQIRIGDTLNLDVSRTVKPLQEKIIDNTYSESVFSFNHRVIISHNDVSILIKNMPMDDEDKCGQLRDSMHILVTGIDACGQSILKSNTIKKQQQQLKQVLVNVVESVSDLKTITLNSKEKSSRLMREMLESLEQNMLTLGLDDDQEKYIMTLVDTTMQAVMAQFEMDAGIGTSFTRIIESLKEATM